MCIKAEDKRAKIKELREAYYKHWLSLANMELPVSFRSLEAKAHSMGAVDALDIALSILDG